MGYARGNEGAFWSLDAIDQDGDGYEDVNVERSDPMDPDFKKLYSLGKLTAFPSAEHLCDVSDLTVADESFQAESFPLYTPKKLADGGTELTRGTPTPNGVVDEDAGTITFPARHMRYEWSGVKFVATSEVPGQLFTASLNVTDDGCTATYDVQGVWPFTLCQTDLDCSPYPLPDAGASDITISGRRFQGSGLNPSLQNADHPFKCNNAQNVHDYTALYTHNNTAYDLPDAPLVTGSWGVCEPTRAISDFTK
jgi:hypothetical protein